MMAVAAALLLSGCATPQPPGEPLVSADDPCSLYRQPIAAVEQSGGLKGQEIATAVGVGVLSGVAVGLLTGKPLAGAAAAVGALALTAGAEYLQRKQQQAGDRQALLASIYQDEVNDGRSFTPAGLAVHQLRACRRDEFLALLHDLKRRQVSHDEARMKFDSLLHQRERDNQIVSDALGVADKRVALYDDALQRSQNAQLYAALYPAPAPTRTVAKVPPPQWPPPLRTVVEQAKRSDAADQHQTDGAIDALHVLLG